MARRRDGTSGCVPLLLLLAVTLGVGWWLVGLGTSEHVITGDDPDVVVPKRLAWRAARRCLDKIDAQLHIQLQQGRSLPDALHELTRQTWWEQAPSASLPSLGAGDAPFHLVSLDAQLGCLIRADADNVVRVVGLYPLGIQGDAALALEGARAQVPVAHRVFPPPRAVIAAPVQVMVESAVALCGSDALLMTSSLAQPDGGAPALCGCDSCASACASPTCTPPKRHDPPMFLNVSVAERPWWSADILPSSEVLLVTREGTRRWACAERSAAASGPDPRDPCWSPTDVPWIVQKDDDVELRAPCNGRDAPVVFLTGRRAAPARLRSCPTPTTITLLSDGDVDIDGTFRARTVVRSAGHCRVQGIVEGDVDCATVVVAGEVRGQLTSRMRCSAHECGAERPMPSSWRVCSSPLQGFDCDDPGVCIQDGAKVLGSVFSSGDVCAGADVTLEGAVLSGDDIAIRGPARVRGQLLARETVGLKTAVTVQAHDTLGIPPTVSATSWVLVSW
ncbi:MAG: polymer-forming cytoskeletal protein [Myxococcota bacterium]